MVKIAVVPPIPSASVTVAAAVNTGAIRNCRKVHRSVLSMDRTFIYYYGVRVTGFLRSCHLFP
jgi:hypothetical protein